MEDLKESDIEQIVYTTIEAEDTWKIGMVLELIDVREDKIEVIDFDENELEETLTYLCTS